MGKISLSKPTVGAFFWIEGEDLERVRAFERRYNALVYAAIRSFTTGGVIDNMKDYKFEDDLFDRNFSMSPAQDADMIYDMAWESFRSCAGQLIQDFKAKKLDVTQLSDYEFSDMLSACLEAIRKQQGWCSKELK